MNALLLRNYMRRAASLQSFKEYRASELQAGAAAASVTSDGTLLEFETLELRLHPPNVVIDNDSYDDMTVITIDSANRPGTLIEVVQCLTELNLSIRKARISSDGGWFVDEFFVTETPKGKVLHQHKLDTIRKVLNVGSEPAHSNELSAVFELSGRDQRGLLAAVLSTLAAHQCEVTSVAVWTYHNQVALVVGVIDKQQQAAAAQQHMLLGGAHLSRHAHSSAIMGGPGPGGSSMMLMGGGGLPPHHPPHARGHPGSLNGGLGCEPDPGKMQALAQVLVSMLGGEGQAHVSWEVVQGDIHHERRLHHLLLQEEERSWETQQGALSGAPSLASHGSLPGPTALLMSGSTTQIPGQAQMQGRISTCSSGGYATLAATALQQQQQPGSNPSATPPMGSPRAGQPTAVTSLPAVPLNQQPQMPEGTTFLLDGGRPQRSSTDGAGPEAAAQPPPESSFASVQQQQQQLALLQQQSSSGPQSAAGGVAVDDQVALPGLLPHAAAEAAKQQQQQQIQHQRSLQPAVSGLSTFPSGGGYVPAPTAMQSTDLSNSLQGFMDPAYTRADVRIQHSPLLKYYLVTITCKDRNKLFFDTVCTLADMQYDVYHGAIDSEADQASQLFYVRPRSGELVLSEVRVRQLAYMLECAVQRRFPKGLRLHVQVADRGATTAIFAALSSAGFSITRAEVRALPDGRAILDLTVADSSGQVPAAQAVARACEAAGGVAADELHPLMAVAGVGGAAAAAATGMARAGMFHPHHPQSSMTGSSTQTSAASGSSAPASGLPPHAPGRQHLHPQHLLSQLAPQGTVAAGPAAAAAAAVGRGGAKFQFAIAHSSDSKMRRGPLGHAASAAAIASGNLL